MLVMNRQRLARLAAQERRTPRHVDEFLPRRAASAMRPPVAGNSASRRSASARTSGSRPTRAASDAACA